MGLCNRAVILMGFYWVKGWEIYIRNRIYGIETDIYKNGEIKYCWRLVRRGTGNWAGQYM